MDVFRVRRMIVADLQFELILVQNTRTIYDTYRYHLLCTNFDELRAGGVERAECRECGNSIQVFFTKTNGKRVMQFREFIKHAKRHANAREALTRSTMFLRARIELEEMLQSLEVEQVPLSVSECPFACGARFVMTESAYAALVRIAVGQHFHHGCQILADARVILNTGVGVPQLPMFQGTDLTVVNNLVNTMHSGRDENCASIIRENIVGREREEFFQTFRYISHSSSEVGVLDPYKKKIQRRRNYNERTDETVPIFFGDLTDVVESIIINLFHQQNGFGMMRNGQPELSVLFTQDQDVIQAVLQAVLYQLNRFYEQRLRR